MTNQPLIQSSPLIKTLFSIVFLIAVLRRAPFQAVKSSFTSSSRQRWDCKKPKKRCPPCRRELGAKSSHRSSRTMSPPRQALSWSTQQRSRAGMGKVTWAIPEPCESLAKGQRWGVPRSGQDPAHRLGWGWGLVRWVARDWHLCNCVQPRSHRQVTL